MASEYQRTTSGVHREYYEKLGLEIDEIEKILADINSRKTWFLETITYKSLLDKGLSLEETGLLMRFIKCAKPANHMSLAKSEFVKAYYLAENKVDFLFEDLKYTISCLYKNFTDRDRYVMYRNQVETFTNKNDLTTIENYGKYDENGVIYQIDHRYSVKAGFLNKVPPQVLACRFNLQYITRSENARKNSKCSITLEELYSAYEKELNNENIEH